MATATRSILFSAPLRACYAIITDYERYPEFLPNVKSVRVSNRLGNTVDVDYEAEVIKSIRYAVRMHEEPPNCVSWTFLRGDFMKENRGGWVLQAEGKARTMATYSLEVGLGRLIPRSVIASLVQTQLPTLLENFQKRIEGPAVSRS